MLLRNLNSCEGLCNGTRLICNDLQKHIISATVASGDFKIHMYLFREYCCCRQQMKNYMFLSKECNILYDYVLL